MARKRRRYVEFYGKARCSFKRCDPLLTFRIACVNRPGGEHQRRACEHDEQADQQTHETVTRTARSRHRLDKEAGVGGRFRSRRRNVFVDQRNGAVQPPIKYGLIGQPQ